MHDVTIIIPVYVTTQEGLVWLEECFQSALSQGCEVAVYDDASPIDVMPLLSKYIRRYSYRKEHMGVSVARNEAIALSETSLILPLDCDDLLAENAVTKLLSAWEGIPVYPDLEKFGDETDAHYKLLDFHCEHLTNLVGFTSVNVLHSKSQWEQVGKYDPAIDFYEDGEYNSRLLGTYCGMRYPEPLVRYRIHKNQRTKQYFKRSSEYALKLLDKIRRYEMACSSCGGKSRRTASNSPQQNPQAPSMTQRGPQTDVMIGDSYKNLPSEFEGKVLVTYLGGKGKGKHYYQGQGSNNMYKVTYGDVLYVDPKDARNPGEMANTRAFERIVNMKAPEPVKVVEPPAPQPPPAAVKEPERVEVALPPPPELPDIRNMTYKHITDLDLSSVPIPALIRSEARGKNRKNVLDFLKGKVI
jgi:hypothetical protein